MSDQCKTVAGYGPDWLTCDGWPKSESAVITRFSTMTRTLMKRLQSALDECVLRAHIARCIRMVTRRCHVVESARSRMPAGTHATARVDVLHQQQVLHMIMSTI